MADTALKDSKDPDNQRDEFVSDVEARLRECGKNILSKLVSQAEEWSVKDPVFAYECIILSKRMISGSAEGFFAASHEYLGSAERLEIGFED